MAHKDTETNQIAEKFGQAPEQVRRNEEEGYKSLDENMAAAGKDRPDPRVNESKKNIGQSEELEDTRLNQEDGDRVDDESNNTDLETSVSQRLNERT